MAQKRKKSLWSIGHYSPESWRRVIDEMMKGDDRSCIIVGATILETVLRCRLELAFAVCNANVDRPLLERLFEGPTSPLSSFSARTSVAYAMGLFGEATFRDLDTIREIRNKVVHRLVPDDAEEPWLFATTYVKQKCTSLKLPEMEFAVRIDEPRIDFTKLPSKGRFTAVVTWIAGGLMEDAEKEAKGLRSHSELP